MAATSVWGNGPSTTTRRRRHHLASVVFVTFAFVVAASAVLTAVGSLTWPVSASAEAPSGAAQPVITPPASDGGTGPVAAPTEGDAGRGTPEAGEEQGAAELPDNELPDDPDAEVPDPPADETVAPELTTSPDVPADADPATPHEEQDEQRQPKEPALEVAELQQLLRTYGFLIGPADGRAGQQTKAAVMAYQRVNGLTVDGVVGPATTAALLEGSAEPSLIGGAPDRIEVDLDAQLLHLVEGGSRTVTLQVSSGNGETYTNANGTARARTPVGDFAVERRIHGLREAPLGTLYDPLYFHRGFAIHGSPSVPPYPASHGCVRVTIADAAWLIERVPNGTPVHVHGGTHVFTPSS